jgi:hypothetical protein
MKKVLIAGIVGGIALFIWSALAWTVLPLHKASLHGIINEDAMIAILKTNLGEKAVYVFPARPAEGQAGMEAYTQKMEQGPVGMIIYDPQGMGAMMTSQFIVGLIIDILAALLAAWILSRSTARGSSFIARVTFCGLLGMFISLGSFLPGWNWMGYALDYTTAMVADALLGWLIAGLVIAAFVKVPAAQPA